MLGPATGGDESAHARRIGRSEPVGTLMGRPGGGGHLQPEPRLVGPTRRSNRLQSHESLGGWIVGEATDPRAAKPVGLASTHRAIRHLQRRRGAGNHRQALVHRLAADHVDRRSRIAGQSKVRHPARVDDRHSLEAACRCDRYHRDKLDPRGCRESAPLEAGLRRRRAGPLGIGADTGPVVDSPWDRSPHADAENSTTSSAVPNRAPQRASPLSDHPPNVVPQGAISAHPVTRLVNRVVGLGDPMVRRLRSWSLTARPRGRRSRCDRRSGTVRVGPSTPARSGAERHRCIGALRSAA